MHAEVGVAGLVELHVSAQGTIGGDIGHQHFTGPSDCVCRISLPSNFSDDAMAAANAEASASSAAIGLG